MEGRVLTLVAILLGWPAVAVSLALSVAGITYQRRILMLAALVAAGPFLLYLCMTPRFQLAAPIVGLLLVGAVVAVGRRPRFVAMALAVPFVAFAVYVGAITVESWVRLRF